MIETTLSSSQLLSYTVDHYIRYNFTPLNKELSNQDKADHIWQNGLHINLGKNVDHIEFGLYLAMNSPYYGVVVKDFYTLTGLKKYYREDLFKHTRIPKTVQLQLNKLPVTTQVLILLEASKFTQRKIKTILYSWTTDKPILFIG